MLNDDSMTYGKDPQTQTGETQSAGPQGTADPGSYKPTRPKPYHTIQKFLLVDVPKGASTPEIANAVTDALKSQEVPFFTRGAGPPRKVNRKTSEIADEQTSEPSASAASSTQGEGESLLILVNEEGWP